MTKKTRVVVVEDDAWLREHYVRLLSRSGFEVHEAAHAIDAIDLIDEVKPQVVLLDVLLTGTTALALLHELRSHDDLAKIPIVLATNAADHISLADVTAYGVKKVIDKSSMHPDEVVAALRAVI